MGETVELVDGWVGWNGRISWDGWIGWCNGWIDLKAWNDWNGQIG